MDYVIQSKNINQLISFLSLPTHQKKFSNDIHKNYMIFKNNLIYTLSGKSIFEVYSDSKLYKELDLKFNFFEKLAYLLEEIGYINAIKSCSLVNSLLLRMNNNESDSQSLSFLLGYMIAYWNPNCDFVQSCKKVLIQNSPFYDLLFMVIEKRSEEFILEFQTKIIQLEKSNIVAKNFMTLKLICVLI